MVVVVIRVRPTSKILLDSSINPKIDATPSVPPLIQVRPALDPNALVLSMVWFFLSYHLYGKSLKYNI